MGVLTLKISDPFFAVGTGVVDDGPPPGLHRCIDWVLKNHKRLVLAVVYLRDKNRGPPENGKRQCPRLVDPDTAAPQHEVGHCKARGIQLGIGV